MTAANNILSYSITHDVTVQVVANETKGDESWKYELQYGPTNYLVKLTLIGRNGGDCSFNVKMSLLDEHRQVKLELVRKGWQFVGCQESFPILIMLINTAQQNKLSAINLAIIKIPKPSMAEKWLTNFHSATFGDVTVETADGKTIRCHKDVLAARSPVFAKMFNEEMKESVENRIRIEDFNYDVMIVLLQFCYLDDWGDLSTVADGLYKAADHYKIDQLKLAAKAELITNLNGDSIVSTLQLAHLYKDELLADGCVDYLGSHKGEISAIEVMAEGAKK